MRSLAQRSAEAAKEIKSLVGASVDKVEAGSRLVGDARTSMDDIVNQVKRVSDLIHEIGQSANEQTAADSLKDQAGKLAGAVGVFRLP